MGRSENTTDQGKKVYYKKGSIDFNVDLNGGYEKKKKSDTSALFYNFQQTIVGKRVEISGYKDTEHFASLLSQSFLNDVQKVNGGSMSPQAFIEKYGTHVIMSAYYGGSIEANYSAIGHKSAESDIFFANLEAGLTYHLSKTREIGGSVSVDYKNYEGSSNSNLETSFSVKALGGKSQSFASLESFTSSFDSWVNSVTEDKYSLIDVPDGSLYCVWEYLDDTYANAKKILNDYMYSQCEENYNILAQKLGNFFNKDDIEFDEMTKTLSVNLDSFQEEGRVDNFNSTWYENGVLTIYPMFNGKDIQTVKILGCYGKRNANGVIVDTLINNFSIKFDSSWYNDFNIVLDSVGLVADRYDNPLLDLEQISNDVLVTIELVGENCLDGGEARNSTKRETLLFSNVRIIGEGDLIVKGASGADGGVNAYGLDGVTGLDYDLGNGSCAGDNGNAGKGGVGGQPGVFYWDAWIGDDHYHYGTAGKIGADGV